MGHVRAAADRYGMIEEGDRIAVGVSGGKDSLYLLYALAMMRRYYPKRLHGRRADGRPRASAARRRTTARSKRSAARGTSNTASAARTSARSSSRTGGGEPVQPVRPDAARHPARHGEGRRLRQDRARPPLRRRGADLSDEPALRREDRLLFAKSYLSRKDLYLIRPLVFCEEGGHPPRP